MTTNKHWVQASKRQIAWADKHGFWVAPEKEKICHGCARVERELRDICDGCALFVGGQCQNPLAPCCKPSITFKRKKESFIFPCGRPCQKNKLTTSSSGNKRPLTEGMVKRGGVNERPTSPKQEIKPPPQRPA